MEITCFSDINFSELRSRTRRSSGDSLSTVCKRKPGPLQILPRLWFRFAASGRCPETSGHHDTTGGCGRSGGSRSGSGPGTRCGCPYRRSPDTRQVGSPRCGTSPGPAAVAGSPATCGIRPSGPRVFQLRNGDSRGVCLLRGLRHTGQRRRASSPGGGRPRHEATRHAVPHSTRRLRRWNGGNSRFRSGRGTRCGRIL